MSSAQWAVPTLAPCTSTPTNPPSPTSRRGSQPSATLFNYDSKRTQLKDLESEMGSESFWNSQDRAKKVVASVKALKAQIEPLTGVIKDFEDAKLAYEMSRES